MLTSSRPRATRVSTNPGTPINAESCFASIPTAPTPRLRYRWCRTTFSFVTKPFVTCPSTCTAAEPNG